MSTRTLFAGILGGIVMFIWSFIGHDLLPLGKAGVHEIPNEDAVASALQANIGDQTGFYHFPGLGVGPDATRQQKEEAMKKAMEKMATAPSGVVIYHPPGRTFNFAKALGTEFATELVEAILLVFLLAQSGIGSFIGRVGWGIGRRHCNQHSLLELVRLPDGLYRRLYAHPGCRVPLRRHCCRTRVRETEPSIRPLIGPFLLARVEHLFRARPFFD